LKHDMSLLVVVCLLVGGVLSQECTITNSFTESSTGGIIRSHGQTFMNGEFEVVNNIWGVDNNVTVLTQTIFNCSQGEYGYSWNRVSSVTHNPCYPEAIFGASPWTSEKSTSKNLPLKLSAVKSIIGTHDISHIISDGNGKNYWDFAYDIWLATAEPGTGVAVGDTITDEIMIWFGWNEDSKPTPVQANAINDGYSVYDYSMYMIMQGKWRYHQFRITGGQRIPKNVNFKPFFDYVQKRYSIPDEWLCDLELGTETGDGTQGSAVFNQLYYSFN